MSRMWRIAGQEWREARRNGRGWWTTGLSALLVLAALFSGARQFQQVREEQRTAADGERAVWLAQKPKSPHSAAHHGFFVFQPVSPLAAFDPGTLEYVGQIRHLEAHGETLPRFTPAEDKPSMRQLPMLTPASTLQMVLPLLLVVLLHRVISEERESGRLGLILSQGISHRALLTGKLLGGIMPLSVAMAVAATGLGLVLTLADWGPWADVLPRALGIAAVHTAWLVIFACVVVVVSARTATSRAALVACVALWLGTAVIGPRVAVEVATHMAPSLTPQEFLAALREVDKERPSYWEDLVPAATARLLARYGVTRPEDLPVSPASVAQLDQEDDDTARVGRVFDTLRASHEAQERWLARLAWFTPLVSIRQLSSAMAGTDAWHAREFARRAEAYRRQAVRLLNEDSVRHNTGDFLETGVRHEGDARLWSSIPPFEDRPPFVTDVLSVNRSHVAVVVLWTLVAVALVSKAARRLRVS